METPVNPLLDFWRSFGDWGFILVIFGCIGEVVAGCVDKFLHKHFEKYKSLWEIFEIAAGAVLIIGLAMEYHGHKKETNILDSENSASYLEAKQAGTNAVAAMLLVAKIGTTNAQLIADNLVLEAIIQPRRITTEQTEIIRRELKDWATRDKCKIEIVVQGWDSEARTLAWQIGRAVSGFPGGFNVHIDEGIDTTRPLAFGIRYFTHDPAPPSAKAIEKASRKGQNNRSSF